VIRGVPETPDQRRTLLGSSAAVRGEAGGDAGPEGEA
jgi:hypothetical protein